MCLCTRCGRVVKFWSCKAKTRDPNEEEEDPHPWGFWLILLPHSPGNEIFDSSYSSFLSWPKLLSSQLSFSKYIIILWTFRLTNTHKCYFFYMCKQILSKVPLLLYFVRPKPPSARCVILVNFMQLSSFGRAEARTIEHFGFYLLTTSLTWRQKGTEESRFRTAYLSHG